MRRKTCHWIYVQYCTVLDIIYRVPGIMIHLFPTLLLSLNHRYLPKVPRLSGRQMLPSL